MGQPPDRTEPVNPFDPFDPFGLWKQSQQAMLESWSKSMTDAVNSGPYAETTGRMLDSYLTVAAPLRKVIDQTMVQLLNQLSLPSRAEVVSLAERLTTIELRLDDLDARLDVIQCAAERTAAGVAALSALLTTTPASASENAGAPNAARRAEETPQRKRGSRAGEPTATLATRAMTGRAPTGRTATRSRPKTK